MVLVHSKTQLSDPEILAYLIPAVVVFIGRTTNLTRRIYKTNPRRFTVTHNL